MSSLHEAAQSVAWFALIVLVGIGVVLWRDYRKERKDAEMAGDFIYDSSKTIIKYRPPVSLSKIRKD